MILNGGGVEVSTGDPMLDLIAEVFGLAIRDAKKGREDALSFLEATFPDWQILAARFNERRNQGQNIRVRAKTRKIAHSVGLPQGQGERG